MGAVISEGFIEGANEGGVVLIATLVSGAPVVGTNNPGKIAEGEYVGEM